MQVRFAAGGGLLKLEDLDLPTAVVDSAYVARLAIPGMDDVTWNIEGDLPDGLLAAPDGRISGIPTEWGQFPIRIRANRGSQVATAHLILHVVREVK